MFWGFLNTATTEILKSKRLCNKSLNKLPKNYYFEILVSKYLKNPGTQTPLAIVYRQILDFIPLQPIQNYLKVPGTQTPLSFSYLQFKHIIVLYCETMKKKSPKNYYFEILVLKYLKLPKTQTLLLKLLLFSCVYEKN